MPRKPLDKRFTDYPLAKERGKCAFPCFRRGRVWAEPRIWVKGRVPCGFSGQRPEPSESLPIPISTNFQGSFEPFSLAPVFHRLLDTTITGTNQDISTAVNRSTGGIDVGIAAGNDGSDIIDLSSHQLHADSLLQ